MQKILSLLVICLFFITIIIECKDLNNIPVYQLLAMKQNEKIIGSINTYVNLEAALFSDNFQRKLVLIELNQLNVESYQQILNKKAAAILIIIGIKNNWEQFYELLKKDQINIPVYFTFQTQQIIEIVQKLKENSIQKFTQFIIKNRDSRMIEKDLQLEDFYGFLLDYEQNKNLPLIMVSASYDAFTPSPVDIQQYKYKQNNNNYINKQQNNNKYNIIDNNNQQFNNKYNYNNKELNIGNNRFSTGAKVLLNVMQRVQEFKQRNNLECGYNILFYLTSSKQNNYESLIKFIETPFSSGIELVNKLDYIIHLDSIGETKLLNVIFNSKDEQNDNVIKGINEIGNIFNTNILITNSNDFQFNKKIKQITIQGDLNPHILSDHHHPSYFENTISLFTELLVKLIMKFRHNNIRITLSIRQDYFQQEVQHLFENNLRYPTYIVKNSFFNQEIYKIFQTYSFNYNKFDYINTHQKFFTSQKASLIISYTVSPFLDLYLFGAISLWLAFLFFVFQTREINSKKK